MTRKKYLASAIIASPHCLYDCDILAGAAPARVLGWSGFQNAANVFSRSRTQPRDVNCCQLYEGFSSLFTEWLEPLGLCEAGRTWGDLRDGRFDRDGALPLKTFGGSLGKGRLHGVGHLREPIC